MSNDNKGLDTMEHILLVEDDTMIAFGLKYALENEGYTVTHCKDVKSVNLTIQTKTFQLAILDMQLPDGNGFNISEKLKQTETAIIFLTIVDDEDKLVRAFDGGAADYITKPFRLRELLARVRRTLNTAAGMEKKGILTIGNATIDLGAGRVSVNGKTVELTALEYRLLFIFASNKSQLLTRTQILENIWVYGENFVEDNTLTVYVKRLSDKLSDAVKIETVRRIGYRAD